MDDFENMSEFSPFTWQPVYADGSSGEIIDFNTAAIEQQSQFSTSRGMLETIVEETSDDEENGLYSGQWTTGSDSFSSGSSETGSVVRVDAAGGEFLLLFQPNLVFGFFNAIESFAVRFRHLPC